MLDDLIALYGDAAIVTVSPYILETGETLGWIAQIDGEEVQDLDVREEVRADSVVLYLVHGGDEVEIGRWSPNEHPYGRSGFSDSLGALGRRNEPR